MQTELINPDDFLRMCNEYRRLNGQMTKREFNESYESQMENLDVNLKGCPPYKPNLEPFLPVQDLDLL